MANNLRKFQRNAPCPCGSGKKYKNCCAKAKAPPPSAVYPASQDGWVVVEDDLDRISNSIIDLIHQGELDEAQRRATELREQHPEIIDGIERLAMVAEARGDRPRAVDLYRQAVAYVDTNHGFDPEARQYYVDKLTELSAPPTP
jgi:tetratricopeptide (TPR) repeat protein